MGKTSQTFYIDAVTREAYLNQGRLIVTEASNELYFRKDVKQLVKEFSLIEVFNTGEITLKNHLGDFVTLERE